MKKTFIELACKNFTFQIVKNCCDNKWAVFYNEEFVR